MITIPLIIALVLILIAEFLNGWTDAPNAIATVISTRVLSPVKAVIMASILNILGALSGVAVATTIGKGIVRADMINLGTLTAAMLGIIIWGVVAWRWGLPISKTHALVAGLTGASLAIAGPSTLLWAGWQKIIIGLAFSTFLGLGGGLLIMALIYHIFQKSSRGAIGKIFGRLQIFSAAFMAFSHGSNDGQKFIGVFALALLLGGVHSAFHIPVWVILLCATIMGIGTASGGWRIIKTLGFKLTRLEPVHGFAAETGAAITIQIASHLGIPLSTTHTITTSIMGVGAVKRFSAVKWDVAKNIVAAWILTFPICGIIAFLAAKIMSALI